MNKAKTIPIDIVQNRDIQRVLLRVFISILIILSASYVYLIGSITFNVLARKALESEAQKVGSRVGELELTYLNSTNKIDKNFAASLGFVEAKNNIFTMRSATSVAVR